MATDAHTKYTHTLIHPRHIYKYKETIGKMKAGMRCAVVVAVVYFFFVVSAKLSRLRALPVAFITRDSTQWSCNRSRRYGSSGSGSRSR